MRRGDASHLSANSPGQGLFFPFVRASVEKLSPPPPTGRTREDVANSVSAGCSGRDKGNSENNIWRDRVRSMDSRTQ
jgi:hypothetical protein